MRVELALARAVGVEGELRPVLERVLDCCLALCRAERGTIVTARDSVMRGDCPAPTELDAAPLIHDGERVGTIYLDTASAADRVLLDELAAHAAIPIKRALLLAEQRARCAHFERLAGDLAHGFNNVLCVITTHASMIDELAVDEAIRDDARTIQRAANTAAKLVHELGKVRPTGPQPRSDRDPLPQDSRPALQPTRRT